MKMSFARTVVLSLGITVLSGVAGLSTFSGGSRALASIPGGPSGQSAGKITDDTLIYDNLREISVKKEREVNFDSDLSRLSAMEKNYKEVKLPAQSSLQKNLQRNTQKNTLKPETRKKTKLISYRISRKKPIQKPLVQ